MTTERWVIYIIVYSLILLLAVMQWKQKLPSVSSLQDVTSIVNSRGGNILWLGFFALLFFGVSVWFGFWVINKITDGKLATDNAVMSILVSWLTGTAFGGAFGAMLKTMTGEGSTSRRSDYGNQQGDGSATVTQTLTFSGKSISDPQ